MDKDEELAETLFRAFMSGDTNKLTTTALPSEWQHLKPSYKAEWIKLAASLTPSGEAQQHVER